MNLQDIKSVRIDTNKIPNMGKKLDSIFQQNSDINKTSYLNWRTQFENTSRGQFIVIGEAFFSSAYNLIQQCLLDNSDKKADSWIFPIMFNIVHGIEVYLKAINAVLCTELNKPHEVMEGGHYLMGLCATAKNLIIEYKNIKNNINAENMYGGIKVIKNFIDNIYEKTDDMTFARYPLTKKKQGHFYTQTLENEVIDLELLKEQIVYVFYMLDFIYKITEVEIENEELA